MIGWSFRIPNKYGHVLLQIFDGIPIKKFTWRIDEDDIYTLLDNEVCCLFSSSTLDGIEFKEKISLPSYYTFFAKLQAFPNAKDVQELVTFGDYINSSCELVILITDGEFTEVYAKDQSYLDKIRENILKYRFGKEEPIYEISNWDQEITSR